MKFNINGYEYSMTKEVKENENIRKSFNLLAAKTFTIDFEDWYQNGFWKEDYIPYVLLDDDVVVSNVSVNIIDTKWENKPKRYIQLGTVMTEESYRGRGLSRWLMERILTEWKDKCDGIYLFANDEVNDFYPKFGFEKASEYQYSKSISKRDGKVTKLDMSRVEDRNLLLNTYKHSNPFSSLPMEKNDGLLMFYCSKYLCENVYFVEQYKAVVIAEYEDDALLCYDIFCQENCTLDDLLCFLAKEDTKTAILGFSPKETSRFNRSERHEEDTTLFILSGKENLFTDNHLMFPLLSHA